MTGHRSQYKQWLRQNRDDNFKAWKTSFLLFDEFGVENCKIELLELYPCDSREELQAREGHHQRESDCVNKQIAGRGKEQYYQENRETINAKKKVYAENHKEETREYKQQYYKENKEFVSNKCKTYYENNKEEIIEQKKQYYKDHKTEIQKRKQQKITCECGVYMCKDSMRNHIKTIQHQQYLNSLRQQ